MIRSMWLFKHNFHTGGTLSCYKACLVANGSNQQLGVDFDKTFSSVVKPATIRIVLSLDVSCKWSIHQLDFKNAFLNGDLSETLLEHAHMVNFSRTPVDTESKLGSDRVLVQDPTLYQSLVVGLQYLTFTLPNLSYAGTLDLGLHLYASSTTSLVGYTNVDWAGYPSTRSAEAKNQGVTNIVAETAWLRNILHELHYPLSTTTFVYCNNVSVVYMSANPIQHQRTKHIEIDIHFV
ncbi:ribonuclease H-like domain-containing protein [Tanacetum coccineum]